MGWKNNMGVARCACGVYISSSTALDLHRLLSEYTNEVNILAFSYANKYKLSESGKLLSLATLLCMLVPLRQDKTITQSLVFKILY